MKKKFKGIFLTGGQFFCPFFGWEGVPPGQCYDNMFFPKSNLKNVDKEHVKISESEEFRNTFSIRNRVA